MYSFDNLKNFLLFFGIEPGCKPIAGNTLEVIVNAAEYKFGREFGEIVEGFFEITPGYFLGMTFVELYEFNWESWEELKIEFES